jgi:mannose/cellobiose epimerase-like protein (N-acyl-D-glucosamine 2-epimerase family)
MNKPVGGRGVKAPYKSTHVRIPEPIKDRVEQLKEMYLSGGLEHYDELLARDYKLAREYENLLTGSTQKSDPEQNPLPSLDDAMLAVKQALKRKKSARETAAIILSSIYKTDVKPDDLKV